MLDFASSLVRDFETFVCLLLPLFESFFLYREIVVIIIFLRVPGIRRFRGFSAPRHAPGPDGGPGRRAEAEEAQRRETPQEEGRLCSPRAVLERRSGPVRAFF